METAGQQAAARVAIALALALAAVAHRLNHHQALLLVRHIPLQLAQVVQAADQMQTAVKDQILFSAPLHQPVEAMEAVITVL